mgnify:CR=1 FL=1
MHSGLDRLRTPESCLIEPNKPRVPAMEPPRMSSIRRNCRTSGAKKWMCLGILVSKRDLNPRRDTSTPLAWNRYQSASIGSWIINFLSRAGQPAEACGRCLPLLKLSVPCRLDSEAKQNLTYKNKRKTSQTRGARRRPCQSSNNAGAVAVLQHLGEVRTSFGVDRRLFENKKGRIDQWNDDNSGPFSQGNAMTAPYKHG